MKSLARTLGLPLTLGLLIGGLSSPLSANPSDTLSVKSSPNNMGVRLFNSHNYEHAKKYFEQNLSKDSSDYESNLVYLARIAIGNQDPKHAKKLIDSALKISPNTAEEHEVAAQAYCLYARNVSIFKALKFGKECGRHYNAAAEIEKHDHNMLRNAIHFHLEAPSIAGGSKASARQYIAELKALSEPASHIFDVLMLDQQDGESALEHASIYAKYDYHNPRYLYDLARFYRDKSQNSQALALFERLLHRYSTKDGIAKSLKLSAEYDIYTNDEAQWFINDSLFQIGELLLADDTQLEKSEELLAKYIATNTDSFDPHYLWARWSLAKNFYKQKKFTEFEKMVDHIESLEKLHHKDFKDIYKKERKSLEK